jgi:hypothetical protein
MIEVRKTNSDEFAVTVDEGSSKTEHTVVLDDDYYRDLNQGSMTKEELIKRSFEFLLQRESKESILSRFNLKVIKRYFPEFEREISTRS